MSTAPKPDPLPGLEELEPCPFCGEQPNAYWQGASPGNMDDGYFAIECCHVHVHTDEEEIAVHDWNLRAPVPSNVEALVTALEQISKFDESEAEDTIDRLYEAIRISRSALAAFKSPLQRKGQGDD